MSLFQKPKCFFWPRNNSLDIYFDLKENNTLKLDINLFSKAADTEIQSLNTYLTQNKIESCTILVPDDVIFTKSFLYDTKITAIDKAEVIGLAESFVHFKIDPEAIDYNLVQTDSKTIIQARIYDFTKVNVLKQNLAASKLKSYDLVPVSAAIAKVLSTIESDEYFLLYPLNTQESTLMLAKGESVYLTANFKNNALEIQKIINYSNLYFTQPINKLYVPEGGELEINATADLNKIPYSQSQIATSFGKASNLPLPILGCIINHSKPKSLNATPAAVAPTVKPTMENNQKNLLPLVAVFIVTAAIASIVIWFVLNRNNTDAIQNPGANTTPTLAPTDTPMPSPTAVPTITSISKKIKIQVLNGTSINGQAAVLKNDLTKLGFSSVAVGNSKETASANVIRAKAASADAATYFQQKLTGVFDNATVETLPDSSTYDVVLLIGTQLGTAVLTPDTPAPAASTSPADTTAAPSKTASPSAKASPTAKVTPTAKATPTITP